MSIIEMRRQAARRLGERIRAHRKGLAKTQQWVADQVGVRRETIIQLESGENVGLHVAAAAALALGMELGVSQATADAEPPRLSETLNLSRTYDWSSSSISDDALIRKVLEGECFEDVAKVALHYGYARVAGLFEKSRSDNPIHRRIVGRMLANIEAGFGHAAA